MSCVGGGDRKTCEIPASRRRPSSGSDRALFFFDPVVCWRSGRALVRRLLFADSSPLFAEELRVVRVSIFFCFVDFITGFLRLSLTPASSSLSSSITLLRTDGHSTSSRLRTSGRPDGNEECAIFIAAFRPFGQATCRTSRLPPTQTTFLLFSQINYNHVFVCAFDSWIN